MGYEIIALDGVKINKTTKRFPVEVYPEQHPLDSNMHTGLLNVNQLPQDVMFDSEHQSDPHTMIIDGRDVSSDGSKLDTIESGAEVNNLTDQQANSLTSGAQSNWHHHDDWYYRKTQISTSGGSSIHWDNLTNKPSSYPSAPHTHDDLYYTETELDNGQLDSRYFTESEITSILLDYSLNTHTHDDLYYTETELDSFLLNKSDIGHTHDDRYYTETEIQTNYYSKSDLDNGQLDNRYYTESEVDTLISAASFGITGSVDTYADLPTPTDNGIIYIVKQTVGTDEEGFYLWNGNWTFLANNTGTSEHNSLSGLNTGEYLHLTSSQYSGLTNGNETSLHIHDDRYFTETEINTLLNNYSLTSHTHDDRYFTETEINTILNNYSLTSHNHDTRYYTQTYISSNFYTTSQLNAGQLNNLYYTETEINTFLSNKSDIGHTHDDRYYTESEVDSLLNNKSNVTHLHDDRYYTESEVDSFLSNKSDTNHLHDDRYFTEAELSSTTDGLSGADIIKATPISGGSANTVQGILEELGNGLGNTSGTLDEAYDFGSSGSGRIIVADSGPVEIQNPTTNAPLQLSNRSNAPSTGLSAGQISIIDNELYIYDGVREKWLSSPMIITCGKNNNADGIYLEWPGEVNDYYSGSKMLKDGTITSASIMSSRDIVKNVYIRINNSSVYTMTTSNNGQYTNTGLDINFDTGDILNIYVSSSGGALFDPVCTMEIKWRK